MTDPMTVALGRTMASIALAHGDGLTAMEEGLELDPRHQAIVYSSMVLAGIDGMQQLALWLMDAEVTVGV